MEQFLFVLFDPLYRIVYQHQKVGLLGSSKRQRSFSHSLLTHRIGTGGIDHSKEPCIRLPSIPSCARQRTHSGLILVAAHHLVIEGGFSHICRTENDHIMFASKCLTNLRAG